MLYRNKKPKLIFRLSKEPRPKKLRAKKLKKKIKRSFIEKDENIAKAVFRL